jgi:3-methyladenine DNA glycosylase AlkD
MNEVKSLIAEFHKHSNSKNAQEMAAYMRGKFSFFGIKTDQRRELCKPFFESSKTWDNAKVVEVARHLYTLPQRECHHAAVELLQKRIKPKDFVLEDIVLFEWFIRNNSWWDTVDFVAPKLCGPWFMKFPEERGRVVDGWFKSRNFWLIRSAILFQLKYKDKTDLDFLFEIILRCQGSDEFFINKAIGWMLRENSKRVPKEIKAFVTKNKEKLAPLSVREALRIIKK